MLAYFAELNWGAVLQIIMIDILLGGDNAVVIALACRNLPVRQRLQGIVWGTLGAIVMRVVLIAFAVTLLDVPFLKAIGGVLLLWIGVKLLVPDPDAHDNVNASDKLWAAVKTVILADLVMSIDNVIAIAAAAENAAAHHQLPLVVFGLVVSVPLIVFGSQVVLKVLDRFPLVVYAGAALLGWIAGGLIVGDAGLTDWLHLSDTAAGYAHYGVSAGGALLVLVVGEVRRRRAQSRQVRATSAD